MDRRVSPDSVRAVRTAAVIERSSAAIVTVGADGAIVDFNPAAEKLFGLSAMRGRGVQMGDLLLPPWERAAHARRIRRVLGRPSPARQGASWEVPMVRADGSLFPAIIDTVAIPAGDGTSSCVCFVRDHTLAKRAEAALLLTQWQLRELAGRIEAAREEERTRIAREMHDELGQQLTAIQLDVDGLLRRERAVARPEAEVLERLEGVSELVTSTRSIVRRLATELRPGILDQLGLAEAIRWQANEFATRAGVRVDVRVTGGGPAGSDAHGTAIFRIFQELLTNVGRHAAAHRVRVHLLEAAHEVSLRVADDGRGFREEKTAGVSSFGLIGIRERAALLGGTFRIETAPGRGTIATVTLPHLGARPP